MFIDAIQPASHSIIIPSSSSSNTKAHGFKCCVSAHCRKQYPTIKLIIIIIIVIRWVTIICVRAKVEHLSTHWLGWSRLHLVLQVHNMCTYCFICISAFHVEAIDEKEETLHSQHKCVRSVNISTATDYFCGWSALLHLRWIGRYMYRVLDTSILPSRFHTTWTIASLKGPPPPPRLGQSLELWPFLIA